MPRWTVDAPRNLDFDDVTALQVRLIAGTVAVMATDDTPSVLVSARPMLLLPPTATKTPLPNASAATGFGSGVAV